MRVAPNKRYQGHSLSGALARTTSHGVLRRELMSLSESSFLRVGRTSGVTAVLSLLPFGQWDRTAHAQLARCIFTTSYRDGKVISAVGDVLLLQFGLRG